MELSESKLLPSLSAIGRYSGKDLAELCFLYLIALHVLRCNRGHVDFAKNYALHTYNPPYVWSKGTSTDLHQFVSILVDHTHSLQSRAKLKKSSQQIFDSLHLSETDIKKFLSNVKSSYYDENMAGQLLLKFEQQLNISVSNYRSVRRISSDWNKSHVDDEARSLAITRLLQALSNKAPNGDMVQALKRLAEEQNLLLQNVCDPETGKNCESPKQKMGLLKQLAVLTGIGITGFLVGKALAKSMNE